MAQDHTQPLIVPQPGFLITQFRPNVPFPRPVQSPVGFFDGRQQNPWASVVGHLPATAPLLHPPPQPSAQVPNESVDRDYRVVSYEDLEKMLPETKASTRVEVGLLPSGEAFAPKTAARGEYLLFPSKASYILYFTHHYFSRENLIRDSTFLRMLVNRLTLPLDKLIQAPRLLALKTTVDEVEQALINSKVVCLEDMGGGLRGVRRIDRFPEESWVPYPSSDNSLTALVTNRSIPPHVPPTFSPNEAEEGILVTSNASVTDLGSNEPTVDQSPTSTNIREIGSSTPTAISNQPSFASPLTSTSTVIGQLTTASANTFTSQATRMTTGPANAALSFDRSPGASWPPQHAGALICSNGYTLTAGSQHSISVGPPVPIGGYQNSLPNGSNYASPIQGGSLHSTEGVPVHALPIRPASCLPQYLLNQGSHNAPAVYAAGPTMNFAMTSVSGGQQATQVASPPFANAVFTGHPNPLATLNATQSQAAWAAAYMTALQQQQQQAAYVHPAVPPSMHAQHAIPSPGQTAFPFYYTTQPFHLPAQLSRHPTAPRLSQTPVYPLQAAYAYSSPHGALLHTSIQQHPTDVSSHLGKGSAGVTDVGSTFQSITNATQVPCNISYPFLLPQHMQVHHTSPSVHNSNAVSGLTAAAANLYIQRPTRPSSTINSSGPIGSSATSTPSPSVMATVPLSAKFPTSHLDAKANIHSTVGEVEPQSLTPSESTEHQVSNTVTSVSLESCNTTVISLESPGACVYSQQNVKSVTDSANAVCLSEQASGTPNIAVPLASVTDEKPAHFNSADDSEDSASSGIGEMNSACSSNTSDALTNSSSTLTDQAIGPAHYPLVSRRQYSHSNRFKDASSKT
ncbi:hypothetical protein X801_06694, partial [Opisthorchis viverrini]|uniref:Uncharacterized protein n=2 Tax=Opisthorchis viverrini TaxID=6198 RepID=A0A074Z9S2_OPIVI